MMALTPKRLFLSLCISISLLRPYTFFSRSPLVFKTLFESDMSCKLVHEVCMCEPGSDMRTNVSKLIYFNEIQVSSWIKVIDLLMSNKMFNGGGGGGGGGFRLKTAHRESDSEWDVIPYRRIFKVQISHSGQGSKMEVWYCFVKRFTIVDLPALRQRHLTS